MWTETYAQIMDRAIIERLKEDEFSKLGNAADKAATARRQAEELEAAARQYISEMQAGEINHIPYEHLRFHDHGVDAKMPDTVDGCLSELARVHRLYWETQTKVQEIKKRIAHVRAAGRYDGLGLLDFYLLQLIIDSCNQKRNEVRTHCDFLFGKEHLSFAEAIHEMAQR